MPKRRAKRSLLIVAGAGVLCAGAAFAGHLISRQTETSALAQVRPQLPRLTPLPRFAPSVLNPVQPFTPSFKPVVVPPLRLPEPVVPYTPPAQPIFRQPERLEPAIYRSQRTAPTPALPGTSSPSKPPEGPPTGQKSPAPLQPPEKPPGATVPAPPPPPEKPPVVAVPCTDDDMRSHCVVERGRGYSTKIDEGYRLLRRTNSSPH